MVVCFCWCIRTSSVGSGWKHRLNKAPCIPQEKQANKQTKNNNKVFYEGTPYLLILWNKTILFYVCFQHCLDHWSRNPFLASAWSGNLRTWTNRHCWTKETASVSYWPRDCLSQSSRVFQEDVLLLAQSCIVILFPLYKN